MLTYHGHGAVVAVVGPLVGATVVDGPGDVADGGALVGEAVCGAGGPNHPPSSSVSLSTGGAAATASRIAMI
jgi:hypothetical protein